MDVLYLSVEIVQGFHARAFIAQNQPFLDGNKRTVAASMLAFLYLNGCALDQTDDQIYEAFIGLGTKELSQADFVAWVERFLVAEV